MLLAIFLAAVSWFSYHAAVNYTAQYGKANPILILLELGSALASAFCALASLFRWVSLGLRRAGSPVWFCVSMAIMGMLPLLFILSGLSVYAANNPVAHTYAIDSSCQAAFGSETQGLCHWERMTIVSTRVRRVSGSGRGSSGGSTTYYLTLRGADGALREVQVDRNVRGDIWMRASQHPGAQARARYFKVAAVPGAQPATASNQMIVEVQTDDGDFTTDALPASKVRGSITGIVGGSVLMLGPLIALWRRFRA